MFLLTFVVAAISMVILFGFIVDSTSHILDTLDMDTRKVIQTTEYIQQRNLNLSNMNLDSLQIVSREGG